MIGCSACHCDPQLLLCPIGAAALIAGPVRREGGGEEEADGGHGPGPPAGGRSAGSHPKRPTKGD